jgi:hypothetical protein
MTLPAEEAPANSVPAAAVIRRGLALFGITGRKGRVGGSLQVRCERPGLNPGTALETAGLSSPGEDGGIPSVEVKFVDIGKNTGGEGGHLDRD